MQYDMKIIPCTDSPVIFIIPQHRTRRINKKLTVCSVRNILIFNKGQAAQSHIQKAQVDKQLIA